MKKHTAKKIAPVIVSLCLIGYYAGIGLALTKINIPAAIKIAVLVVSIIITVVVIFVLIERIKEIDRGEEDDLGKY